MDDITAWLSEKVTADVRRLLETKHLYQSVRIDGEVLEAESVKGLKPPVALVRRSSVSRALADNWIVSQVLPPPRPVSLTGGGELPPRIYLLVNKIKVACSTCKHVSPFNIARTIDVFGNDKGTGHLQVPEGVQNFVFLFDCQSCNAAPDVFLVRRQGLQITLCGRSPIEMVPVPAFIPASVTEYYRNSIVAFQSGQTLAAIFLLRVIIEQFTRLTTKATADKKVDQVLDLYMSSLDANFNAQFPSLKDIYGKLSIAIHSASDSSDLFEEALAGITEHFDARRLFKLKS